MDSSKNNFDDFLSLLQKQSSKKPSALYGKVLNTSEQRYKPEDVVKTVYSQIKAISSADCVKSVTGDDKNKNKIHKTNFLPVNKLPVYSSGMQEVHKTDPNKFETQCVSNTQLINIIDHAEAINSHRGMTQEFDITFTHIEDAKGDDVDNKNAASSEHLKDADKNKLVPVNSNRNKEKLIITKESHHKTFESASTSEANIMNSQESVQIMRNKTIIQTQDQITLDVSSQLSKADTENAVNSVPNSHKCDELKAIYDNPEMDIDTGQDQRSLSPVLNNNIRKRKMRSPSPLVVSLELFENFENIAIPLIEENTDFETAKYLINSQILGKELCLNTNTDNIMFETERNYSPELEFKSDELQINSRDLMTSPIKKKMYDLNLLHDSKDVTEKYNESLKDEILFSSDEENDYIHKDLRDLPLTTHVLETSFCDQLGVDNTLYVGFQTASNKSIQVCKESFEEAHSILDDVKTVEKFSLSELVEKCDNLCTKLEKSGISTVNIAHASETVKNFKADLVQNKNNLAKETIDMSEYENTNEYSASKQKCIGFMTANNKKIKMSEKALKECHKIFKDIDLNEKFDAVEKKKAAPAVEKETCLNEREKNPDSVNSLDMSVIDDRINDELLLQEFENIEMSLKEKETTNKISTENMAKTKKNFQNTYADLDRHNNNNTDDAVVKSLVKEISPELRNGSVNLIGFKTASDKNITTSAQAFAKTKSVFQDIETDNIDIIEDTNQPSTSKDVFEGFKTANDKEIKISDEALTNTKNIFKDIGKQKPKIKPIEDIKQQSDRAAPFLGFRTANNKMIKISDEAISITKNVFKDIDKETPKIETVKDINQSQTNNALSKSKNMFYDVDKEIPLKYKSEINLKGVKTASNDIVTVSEQAFVKSQIFQNIDMNDNIDKLENITEVHYETTKMISEGFKSANNKVVNISEENVVKSKTLLADLDAKNFNDKIPYVGKDKIENLSNIGFKGFQTASKKPVTVSADAIARSKKIFQDIDVMDESVPETVPKSMPYIGFEGFQTGNKKSIEVSTEDVSTTKKLFDETNDCRSKNSESHFTGFKTASNRHVNISEEALAKSKKIFDGIEDMPIVFDDVDSNSNKKEPRVPFKGFQTGNHKSVSVSEEALAKSKELFLDMNIEIDINNTNKDKKNNEANESSEAKNPTKVMFGFQTGNNKQINVSEDALKKSKKLFAEDTTYAEKSVELKENNSTNLELDGMVNINSILNTQVLNNFNEDMCTEDFNVLEGPNKRSGSPILSCPKAKKRKKFETPYNLNPKIVLHFNKDINEIKEPVNLIKFKEDYKKNKKYTLQDLKDLEVEKTKNIDQYILNFSLENMLDFEFEKERNDLNDGKITIEEIKLLFAEATDKKLIPEGWMDIQLKLIIWKLISYEIKFPNTLGKVCTVRNVIDQLKYRYDKELYNTERPILRKILEKDDVASKTMVLCVAGIYIDGVSVACVANPNNIELLLTDGWYFVKATIDKMLSKLVYDGKIVIGCKIVTCGAELVNCEQGVSPWEDTSSVRLSISGNSTRRAPWSAKLGLRPGAVLTRLSDVSTGGGRAARLRAKLTRVYPRLYVEKFQDGSTMTRSERLELQYQMKYEAEREEMIEKIYEEVEKEFFDQESQDSDVSLDASGKRRSYDSGSQIAKLMKISKDPMEFRAQLTSTQNQQLQDHVSKQRDRYLQAIQDRVQERLRPRNVVTLARGRIADVKRHGDRVAVTKGMLSIWKPNDEVLDIFKEGSWLEITNVVPTSFRNSEIQLSAGRQSVFRTVKCQEEKIIEPHMVSLKRTCHKIKDLSHNPAMTTDYNEIDTVGIIFSIDPPIQEFELMKNQFQNLYLADIDKNIICVIFWGGIKKFGYENVLDTGQVVYCGNLQKRAGNTRKNVPQYRATEFSLFTKTPKSERARQMVDEMNKKMFGLDRRKFCDDCVAVRQNYSVIKSFDDSENVTPYRFNKSEYNLRRNKMFIDTPSGVKIDRKIDDFNLSGLDFESTFKQQDTQELSPKTLLRKKKVNEKIAKLKMYGEPPPLSPMNIINKSINATNSYKSPLLKSESVATPLPDATSANNLGNVATPTKLPDDRVETYSDVNRPNLDCFPTISINRTYVKRSSVNPVRLNFSKSAATDKNNSVDHFAEDFDDSPPLSLD